MTGDLRSGPPDAAEAARLIARGKRSSEEIVGECLERIAEREHDVRAWAWLDADRALAEARARDADRRAGAALGPQTAGSITRPAAYCGVLGLKPTFGSVDPRGVKELSPPLDTVGGFARRVEDLALLAEVLGAGAPPRARSFEA